MAEGSNQRKQSGSVDDVTIEIPNSDEALVSSIKNKMETISPSLCIYKVPENLCKENEKVYAPEMVSIGPLHHNKEGLKSMEEQKWRYLRALLSRKPNLEASLDDCVKAIRELEQRARNCYKERISLSSDKFVEMMIVDGCFIIELFFKYTAKGLRCRGDPIFSKNGMFFGLRCDMILLENQLPFFVLQRLFDIIPVPKQCDQPLIELAFRFFKIIIPGDKEVAQKKFSQQGNHLLDLIRNAYLPSFPTLLPKQKMKAQKYIHCATKLQESGVKFKKATTNSLLDIRFVNGVLEIPPLKLHYTDSLLRNLIALEQCCHDCTTHITSYAFFMGSLINSCKDVQLLHQRGIIVDLGNEEDEVLLLFKKLCNEVVIKDFYYAGLCEQVNAYRRSNWWATPKYNYFKTRKTIFLIIVAILFLVLTFTGTLFSVLLFFLHRS